MYVKIGHARHDENGGTRGGLAGDQNREVVVTDWYEHPKEWVVFRCKDALRRDSIALAMEIACANNHIGYDQSQRNTLFYEAKKYNYKLNLIRKNVETDCSGLVRVCIASAYGRDITGDFVTRNMSEALLKTGQFVKYTLSKYCKQTDYLRRGDILCTKTKGHTVVVLNDGGQAIPIDIASHFNHNYCGTYTTKSVLNLRTGAGTDRHKIITMPKGLKIESDGHYAKASNGNIWLKVYIEIGEESFKGYCSKDYLNKYSKLFK